jgi:hypothetical protein
MAFANEADLPPSLPAAGAPAAVAGQGPIDWSMIRKCGTGFFENVMLKQEGGIAIPLKATKL